VSAIFLLAQTLTNLTVVPVATGAPPGWRLARMTGVEAPVYRVTASRALRITATNQGGTLTYRLRNPVRPPASQQRSSGRGLTWRWRAETPLRGADLKRRAIDDSPIRVLITFQDGRVIAYSWGNREGRGESFASWAGRNRMVIVLQRAEDADGSWHVERRDPFTDYRRLWNNAPKPIVSVAVQTDTDGLKVRAAAEIGDITWEGP
jgi:PAS domain-containing protein